MISVSSVLNVWYNSLSQPLPVRSMSELRAFSAAILTLASMAYLTAASQASRRDADTMRQKVVSIAR